MNANPEEIFVTAWAFLVRPEFREDFEKAYGPAGDWVRLFRTGRGYIKTELHRDPEGSGRYITLDFWNSREQYDAFRQSANAAYQEIDAKCQVLTEDERLLGEFGAEASVRTALPRLGTSSLVLPAVMIRTATVSDIPAILEIERSSPSATHWAEGTYAAMFQPGTPLRIVLTAQEADQELRGFLIARIAADECELENIVVTPQQTRQGIGSALLGALLDAAQSRGMRRIFLEVRESNHAARRLYQKCGFTLAGERNGYYSDPVEKAILYSLAL